MTDWVRLWHDMPTDPKWRSIARKSGQPLPCVIALFSLIMVNASSNSDNRGTLHNWDDEDASAALDMEPEDVSAIMVAMQGKVLDGDRLTGWEKRQPKREDGSAADRKRAQRKREAEQDTVKSREITNDDNMSRIVTHCHAPETETETELLEAKASRPSGDEPDGDADLPEGENETLKPEHVVESWNELAARLAKPTVRALTPERRALLKARIAQHPIADFLTVFGKIERSAFLRGDTGRFSVTFDWVFKKANFQKVLEGNYDG